MEDIERAVAKHKCEESHLFFTRYFFKHRHGQKFIVNWHHEYMAELVDKVINGNIQNLIINVSPGSSKTEEVVINFMARGLALNPRARFLHLSYSDDLAALNSQAAREIVTSEEFRLMWPLTLSTDTKAKKRWNIMLNGKKAGGVYATSLNGQVTGFRAGHMEEGFQGVILIDDPMKPEDAFSKPKVMAANRRLMTTVKSRRAHPKTPIVMIMQRLSETDCTGFIEKGGLPGDWTIVKIPALMEDQNTKTIPEKYIRKAQLAPIDSKGRYSYWEYKEPLKDLAEMADGKGLDVEGNRISKHVFNSQWQQTPVKMGGNIIKGEYFKTRWTTLPKLKYRMMYADTAQKTKEANDFSVFFVVGLGIDNRLYAIDLIKDKWESPALKRAAKDFWAKHNSYTTFNPEEFGNLRKLRIEDKSSGTGLIQELKSEGGIPVEGIPRDKDKYTRVQDALPYFEQGDLILPAEAPWVSDFIDELEAFTVDDTHAHDDQVDVAVDAVVDNLSTNSGLKTWERLGEQYAKSRGKS